MAQEFMQLNTNYILPVSKGSDFSN